MSNVMTLKGTPYQRPLFGAEGYIKNAEVIRALPQTAAEMAARFEDVPLEKLRSYGNRDSDVESINKIIRNRGGIDGSVWEIKGARIRGDEDADVFIYDGDHSRHIFVGYYPTAKTVPVNVKEVDSLAEVNELFVFHNKKGKTTITTEQTLVNEFHAGYADAVEKEQFLSNVGAYVYCSHEESGKIGDTSGAKAKVFLLNKLMTISNQSGADAVRAGIETSTSLGCYDATKPLHGHITKALSMMYGAHPELMEDNEFKNWMIKFSESRTYNSLTKEFQDYMTGSQESIHVAYGMVKAAKKKASTLPSDKKKLLSNTKLMDHFGWD